MPVASSGGRGEDDGEDLSLRLDEFAEATGRRLLERISDSDAAVEFPSSLSSSPSPQWLEAAATARSAGPLAAARFMVSSGSDAWGSSDAAVVRAVAGLAIAATSNTGDAANGDASASALAGLAALPRALAALRASRDLAGGSLPQLVESVKACSSAMMLASSSPLLATAAEASLLAAAASAAAVPPPDALFASVGGDPLLVGQSELGEEGPGAATDAAKIEWRDRARACAAAAGAAVAAVGEERLREAGGRAGGGTAAAALPPRTPPAPSPPPPPPASSLWDITGSASSRAQPSASAVAAAGARVRGPLIEVLEDGSGGGGGGGGESFDGDEEEEEKDGEKDKAAAAAATEAEEALEAAALESAQAQALCLAALYSRDGELGCSWANDLESGDEGENRSFPFLSDLEPLPRAAARLLPRAMKPLHAALLAQNHWQEGLDSVKIRAYEGPGVFERSCAAYTLSILLRWISEGNKTDSSSCTSFLSAVSVALPALLAAADDPAPAVARLGLLSLARLSGFLKPKDLKEHSAEVSLLAAAARKAALGSDERAAVASTAAAAALAVALDQDDEDDGEVEEETRGGEDAPRRRRKAAECCSSILSDLLDDAQRHAHEPERSTAWLRATRPVFERLGLGLAPSLSTRALPLLARWLLLSSGDGDGGRGSSGRPSSSGSSLLLLQTEAARTLTAITKRAWPRVGSRAHALPLWSAAAVAFRRTGRGKDGSSSSPSSSSSSFTASLLELASAFRAAAWAVKEASTGRQEPSSIDESFAEVDGGAALLEAVTEREKQQT